MAIKVTAGGKIITRDGKVSCACCGIFVEHNSITYGPLVITTTYFEMAGSAGGGYTGTGPGGTFTLSWNVDKWILTDPLYGVSHLHTSAASPAGYYVDYDTPPFPVYTATVSHTPLP